MLKVSASKNAHIRSTVSNYNLLLDNNFVYNQILLEKCVDKNVIVQILSSMKCLLD